MGFFQVRYQSRDINYDRRGFIRLATEQRNGPKSCIRKMVGHTSGKS